MLIIVNILIKYYCKYSKRKIEIIYNLNLVNFNKEKAMDWTECPCCADRLIELCPLRLVLEGQIVFSMNGERMGKVVGKSTSGKSWKLSTGSTVLKKDQNQTWRVNGNLIGHKIFSCQDNQLWGIVTGQDER